MGNKSSYVAPLVGGVVGILGFAVNAWMSYSPDLEAIAQEKQRAETLLADMADKEDETARQIAEIEAYQRIEEARAKAGLDPQHEQLRLISYVYDPNIPPNIDLSGYLPTDFAKVVDRNRRCIGFIYQKHFSFLGKHSEACNTDPRNYE